MADDAPAVVEAPATPTNLYPATPAAEPTPADIVVEPAMVPPAPPEPTAEEPKPEGPAPIEITLPEGFTADEAAMTSFKEVLVDPALSANERAQKLVDLFVSQQTAGETAATEAWTSTQETWQNEIKADPVIGGSKLDATLTIIAKAIDQFGSPEVREAFDLTGAGNNPHVVRFIHKMASQLQEGRPVIPAGPAAKSATPAEKLYGS